jgi:hypothetical protein
MEPIDVRFTFTEATFIQLHRQLANRVLMRRKWLIYLVVVMLLVMTISAALMGRIQILLAYLLPLLLFLVFWRVALNRASKKLFANQPSLHHPIHYVFKTDQIEMDTYGGESSLHWHAFQWVEESPDSFLMYQNQQMANPVLKSGFANTADETRFRNLLQEKGLLKG